MRVKFYWGRNADTWRRNSAEEMLQELKREGVKNICDFGEGSYAPSSIHFDKGFLLVKKVAV